MSSQIEEEGKNDLNHSKTKNTRHRLHLICHLFTNNKEIITRPMIALIPSIFSVLYFIGSFSLNCQNIHQNNMRYLMIVFYFISFIPQMITFLLYVYPSSLYFSEWRLTIFGQWTMSCRQSSSTKHTMIFSLRHMRS